MPQNPRYADWGAAPDAPSAPVAAAPSRYADWGTPAAAAPAEEPSTGSSLLKLLAGGAALAGAGYLAAKSGKIKPFLEGANDLRQQLMLTGWAIPKSILGGIGATAVESAERGSMDPLKALFSRETLQDVGKAWKQGSLEAQQALPGLEGAGKAVHGPGSSSPWAVPGRVLNATDEAIQKAMQRGGVSAEEAATANMQAPLPKGLADALDSPVGRYLVPFRRTPFNQFIEGFKTFRPENFNPAVQATVGTLGGLHGAATADEKYPTSVGLGAAAAAKYGLTYAGGATLGRMLAGGKGNSSTMGSALPVSEYGVTSSIEAPLQPFKDPAALRALRQLLGKD